MIRRRTKKPGIPDDNLLRRATSRMDAFSDGVFAIAITILVLEIAGPEPERVAVMFYGLVLLLMSLLIAVMWRYAVRANLVDRDIPDEQVHAATKLLAPSLGFYVVALAVAYFRPEVAVLIMLLAAVLFWIPAAVLPRRGGAEATAD